MPKRIHGIRVLDVPKNATLKEIYRESKKQFTAADLAKFCRNEPMVPAEKVMEELEAIHKKAIRERKRKKK